jgi:hypothetical protein
MTKEQIEKYEILKKDLQKLENWKENLPFGRQNHGCGSKDGRIFFELEDIHRQMYESVELAMNKAVSDIRKMIDEL